MKSVLWLPLCILVSVATIEAAPLFDSLGVIKTNFKITLNDTPLEISRQGITQRVVTDEIRGRRDAGEEVINHIAYQAYHLELAYKLKFIDQRDYAVIEFYNSSNELIHEYAINDKNRSFTTSSERRYDSNYLALSLKGVPLVMLDSVSRINLRKSK